MYGILNYNPFGPHSQPLASPGHYADVPPSRFEAAQAVNATHLSSDGLTAYDERQLGVWYSGWNEEEKAFGSWFRIVCGILPADAVRLE